MNGFNDFKADLRKKIKEASNITINNNININMPDLDFKKYIIAGVVIATMLIGVTQGKNIILKAIDTTASFLNYTYNCLDSLFPEHTIETITTNESLNNKPDNLKTNVELTLENNQLNILLENSAENKHSVIEEVYITAKVDSEGEVIENLPETKIAETYILHPGSTLDYVSISDNTKLQSGYYEGKIIIKMLEMHGDVAFSVSKLSGKVNITVNND